MAVDPADWLRSTTRPGDLLLTGSSDPMSRLIQRGTRSQVSHAAIVATADTVIEAYDYGLTPNEEDEGVFETSFDDLVARSAGLDHLMVRRPDGWCQADQALLTEALLFAVDNSPPFPTTGTGIAAGLVLLAHPAIRRLLDAAGKVAAGPTAWGTERLVAIVGDGDHRVHCSELATRVYTRADLELRFVDPVLGFLLFDARGGKRTLDGKLKVDRAHRPDLASLSAHRRRRARRSERPTVARGDGSKVKVTTSWEVSGGVVSASISAARDRVDESDGYRPDMADLILPADYVRAEPFTTVGTLARRRGLWSER